MKTKWGDVCLMYLLKRHSQFCEDNPDIICEFSSYLNVNSSDIFNPLVTLGVYLVVLHDEDDIQYFDDMFDDIFSRIVCHELGLYFLSNQIKDSVFYCMKPIARCTFLMSARMTIQAATEDEKEKLLFYFSEIKNGDYSHAYLSFFDAEIKEIQIKTIKRYSSSDEDFMSLVDGRPD